MVYSPTKKQCQVEPNGADIVGVMENPPSAGERKWLRGQTWPSTGRKALTFYSQVQSNQEADLVPEVPKQETPPGQGWGGVSQEEV